MSICRLGLSRWCTEGFGGLSFLNALSGASENNMRVVLLNRNRRFHLSRADWTSNDSVGVHRLRLIDISSATINVEQWMPLSFISMDCVQITLLNTALNLLSAILFEHLNSLGGINSLHSSNNIKTKRYQETRLEAAIKRQNS